MKLEVKKVAGLEEGEYFGLVVGAKYRSEPYEYIDFYIKPIREDEVLDVELKTGFPAYISITQDGEPSSSLAKFLANVLNVNLEKEVDIDDINTKLQKNPVKIKFYAVVDENGFLRISKDTIKRI